jgi:hypothetical protein
VIVIVSLIALMYMIDALRQQARTYMERYQYMIDVLKK